MDRAVKIARSLTTVIQNVLKEPRINTGRHDQALENLAKIFENAIENLETQQQRNAQKLVNSNHSSQQTGHTKGACLRDAQ